jgi:catechol 2,3-dioxygenase-like lactoylglutathione lyase family enzyme
MLSNYPIDVVLLAMDLAAAKDFYADKLGLPVLSESPASVTFQCGGDSHLVVTKSSVGTKDEQTQASFRVADIGFAWMAWFIDPGQNCVGMMQLKNP